jgi:GDP-L-fucose synthase
MEEYSSSDIINIGTGTGCAVRELALLVKEIIGFGGEIRFNPAMPDGTTRKLLDVSRLTALGWQASTPLKQGLALTYEWFLINEDRLRQ